MVSSSTDNKLDGRKKLEFGAAMVWNRESVGVLKYKYIEKVWKKGKEIMFSNPVGTLFCENISVFWITQKESLNLKGFFFFKNIKWYTLYLQTI